jgi:hypothetical protein
MDANDVSGATECQDHQMMDRMACRLGLALRRREQLSNNPSSRNALCFMELGFEDTGLPLRLSSKTQWQGLVGRTR